MRSPDRHPSRWWAHLTFAGPAALVAMLALAAYLPSLHHPFVMDDEIEILTNTSIEDLSQPMAVAMRSPTRPLVNLSYAVDFWFWGGRDRAGFHLTNILLHVVNALLLFGLTWHLTRKRRFVAFIAAALFSVHPMMTETVVYISSRSELLYGALLLTSFHCFRQAFDGRGPLWWAAALVSFVLSLASKETAAMLPVCLLVYDRLLRHDPRRVTRARLWRLHVPLLALVLIGAATRVWIFVAVEHPESAGIDGDGLLSSAHAVARYVLLLVLPIGQTVVPALYPIQSLWDARVLTTMVVLGPLVAAAILARAREPLVSFGVVWFFALLVPSSALILLSEYGSPMAEHRTYLASWGFFLCVGLAADQIRRLLAPTPFARPLWTTAAVGVLLAVLLSLTLARNRVWADPVTLWGDAVEKAPNTWWAVHGLADAHRHASDCGQAVELYQHALTLRTQRVESYLGLADCSVRSGQPRAAAEVLRLANIRVPGNTTVLLHLATMEETAFRDTREALRLCREALALAPNLAEAQACVVRLEQQLASRPH